MRPALAEEPPIKEWLRWPMIHHAFQVSLVLSLLSLASSFAAEPFRSPADRVATVTVTPGCVAFWDFAQREPSAPRRSTR
jgi:hypothetical protein